MRLWKPRSPIMHFLNTIEPGRHKIIRLEFEGPEISITREVNDNHFLSVARGLQIGKWVNVPESEAIILQL